MRTMRGLGLSLLARSFADTTATLTGARLDPPTQKFVDSLPGGPPLYTLSPTDARKVLDDLQGMSVAKLPADITERTVPGGPTGDTSVRIVRPQGVTETLPAIIYVHGGGWILGNAETHDRLVREIANGARAAVIFVNYTPSPEAHFPVAIEQEYAVAKYVAEHGSEFNVD